MFAAIYPELNKLNIMGLHSPQSAVLAAVIFNAVIIIALVPLALRGVQYKPVSAGQMLTRNLLIYGLGGIIVPFPGIWLIDKMLVALHLALAQVRAQPRARKNKGVRHVEGTWTWTSSDTDFHDSHRFAVPRGNDRCFRDYFPEAGQRQSRNG